MSDASHGGEPGDDPVGGATPAPSDRPVDPAPAAEADVADAVDTGGASATAADAPTRFGFIAVIGATNAGKSTLVNALVGTKVSIVSHKVQTTRTQIRGIAMVAASQLVFIDTPGIFAPRRRLDRAMVDAAWGSADDVDVVVLLIDAKRGLSDDVAEIVRRLGDARRPVVVVLNKIDKFTFTEREQLLALAGEVSKALTVERLFMISALDGDGVDDIKAYLADRVPLGPWHYPEDDVSDAPLRFLAAEITRERIYHWLHQELPYETTVETASWQDRKDGSVRIEQTIYVARESQRSIVLGKGGQMIKTLSTEAREELSAIVEKPVHLFLFVKVRQSWETDPERYREMGLDYPKD
jgi:GTP-binding protein Era